MNNARDYWDAYVASVGGLKAASVKLSTPYSTLAGISNGSRGIGKALAVRFAEADPMLDASRLIWVHAERRSA